MSLFLDKVFRFLRTRLVMKNIPKGAVVCDIGCGSSPYLLEKIKPFIKQGVGVDQDVFEQKHENIEFKKIRIGQRISVESSYFDAVTMVAFLEHLENPEDVLKEVLRILKNEGKVVITTPTPIARPILDILAALGLIDKKEIADHKNYFWPNDLQKMLLVAGFKKEKIKFKFFEFFTNSLVIAHK